MKTTPTRLTVSLEHIGAGGLIGVASAEIDVAGVVFVLHGFEVRRGADGRLQIDVPAYARAGRVTPCVELPDDLQAAIGREIGAIVGR